MHHENCIPLDWLHALPARLRAAILNCELTLDDTLPSFGSPRRARPPRFIPRSDSESLAENPASSEAEHPAAQRVERLARACRVSEDMILRYVQSNWGDACASLSDVPGAVLEHIARAWPDVLEDIVAPERGVRMHAI